MTVVCGFRGSEHVDADWGLAVSKIDDQLYRTLDEHTPLTSDTDSIVFLPESIEIQETRSEQIPIGVFWRRRSTSQHVFQSTIDSLREKTEGRGVTLQKTSDRNYGLFSSQPMFRGWKQNLMKHTEGCIHEWNYEEGKELLAHVSPFFESDHPKLKTLRGHLQQKSSLRTFQHNLDRGGEG